MPDRVHKALGTSITVFNNPTIEVLQVMPHCVWFAKWARAYREAYTAYK